MNKSVPVGDPVPKSQPSVDPLQAVALVKKFISKFYNKFASSELTLRHLKSYVIKHHIPSLKYSDLRRDDNSLVIENIVDMITKRCEGGKKDKACVMEEPDGDQAEERYLEEAVKEL